MIDCLSPFCSVLFLEFCSVLSFGPYFFVSSFWQPPCVCFCVLGRAALTPCLSAPVKLYGTEPQVIARVRQSMSPLCCSVLGMACRGDSAAAWPLEMCPGESCLQHLPCCQSLRFPVCHLCPSSCCLVLKPRGWVCISPETFVGPSGGVSRESCLFFCRPNPHWFLQPEVMGTYLPGARTLG